MSYGLSSCPFFFFSSRRRHTRSLRDWSSDVCSSDLVLRHRLFQPRLSVQRTALEVGLTRGRVYEIVAEASQALDIRWPRGWRRLLELRSELADAVAAGGAYRESLSRVEVTISLLFRDRRPGSSALGESE